MKKNVNMIILFLIIAVIVLGIIFGLKIKKSENVNSNVVADKETSNRLSNEETNRSNRLSNEEIQDGMNELEDTLANKTDKVVLMVNGEQINEREIAFIDFQINNKYVNKEENKKDATVEAIKQYVILQNAKENNIKLTETRSKEIETRITSSLKQGDEETDKMLKAFHMKYDEFIEFYIDRNKKSEIVSNWKTKMMTEINNEKISIDYKAFNEKVNQYTSSTDIAKRTTLLKELVDTYIEYLMDRATIEYIN